MGDSRKKIKLAFLLTATAAVVACRQMDSSSPSISVTVPTIQLHESSVALNTNWALSKEPLIDIGIHTGLAAYEFHRVKSAKKMSDGRIVVANSGPVSCAFTMH